MQKLIKRTAEAQRAAARRAKKKSLTEYLSNKHRRIREQARSVSEIAADLRAARLNRRQNWELGPLAPRLDLDGKATHAAQEAPRTAMQTLMKPWEIQLRCAWAGTPELLNLVVGDRVVVMEGPEKGKIDRVASIDMRHGTINLENIGKYLSKIPDEYRSVDPEKNSTRLASVSLPISAVRLVHPITDPKTGITRDVIVRSLTAGPVKWHRHTGWRAWTRYITGLNVAIPWPERKPEPREDYASDTKRADVEEPTFVPSLLRCPLPDGLIDQLRNRYSRFRTRHEEAYIQSKEAEEAEKLARHREAQTMLTPLQEFNRLQRALRRERGQPTLSEEMLVKIGEVIARNKAAALGAAGMSEVKKDGAASGDVPTHLLHGGKDAPSPTPSQQPV
ncbi:KOW motif domain-containing protein [Sodiomyces alkalinus F11]|uniref:KOW motif domain-containing protein n=1 Tax=Sodiomyces alkalinus (strain CBS 110278 / VKM F-3762 / F11) TaxID=1314773 RepID=A0A3N2QAN8_SODAK|nr:KOW motif domain-containing protein [Sodiomyces alkalinus F11]ROT43725.1 KOW motif domain-containing protein [Sodiomyces alkalinus F11]